LIVGGDLSSCAEIEKLFGREHMAESRDVSMTKDEAKLQ
jgi:hypothetical protein